MWMLRMLTFITCDCTGFTVRSSHNNQPDCKDSLIQFCVTECLNRKLLRRFSLSELRHSDTEQHWELIIQPSNYSLFSNVRTMTLLIISFINPSKSCVTSFWKKRLAELSSSLLFLLLPSSSPLSYIFVTLSFCSLPGSKACIFS